MAPIWQIPALGFLGIDAMPRRALLYRRPTEPATIHIFVNRVAYPVRIRRHRQARRYTLTIHAVKREAILTMPPRGNLQDAKAFAMRHGAWIAARLNGMPKATLFAHEVIIPFRGKDHRIVHRPLARGTVWTDATPAGERLLCVAGGAAHLSRRVHDFLKREARRELEMATKRHAEALGVTFKRMSLRDQISRWGSCSSTGTLCFSWRLIFAPPFVLDYLAAHEVAHLVEMNHSARFWRLVGQICERVDHARLWLDTHGNDLHRYGGALTSNKPAKI